MFDEPFKSALQEIEQRLEKMKIENPAEYERVLTELRDALEDFTKDLRAV